MSICLRRREFIAALGGAAAWPLAATAQQGERVRRVGVLLNAAETEVEYQGYLAAFRQEMRRLGWSEGQNLQLDVRWNAGDAVLSRTYAGQLIGLMPDAIVTGSTVNLAAVQQRTKAIPIVFVSVADAYARVRTEHASAGRKCHRF
jgi:putative ABC transport system substrate-binding protein